MKYLNGLLLCLSMTITGCSVSAPGSLERSVAKQVKQRVTVGGSHDVNPLQPTAANIKAGEQEFQNYCTSCHSPDGKNTGVMFADRMSPPVPLLDSAEVQDYKDGQLKWIIANGIYPSGMPAWKGNLDDDQMWKIVTFIRSLPKK